MDNNLITFGLSQPFGTPSSGGIGTSGQQPSAVQELLAPDQATQVPLNQDLPETSQIPEVNNQSETRTNQTNNAEADPAIQQQQIESFLAEQTGQDEGTFRGIDIQSALELQENLRNRPETSAFSPANESPDSPVPADANEQQAQEIQQRLQNRLADQIATDPGTEFPQLIETVA